MCVVRIGIRVCTGSNGAAFLLPSPIPSVGMRVRCVREDMINPLQFIFRQPKLILFILWNLFSSSLASVLFLFACADAASVHYNHSFDSRNRGVSILSSFFFATSSSVCRANAVNGYALDESQKQSEQTRKQIAAGRKFVQTVFLFVLRHFLSLFLSLCHLPGRPL